MCVISFANCWSVFPSDLAMAPSVRRAFWETAGETSELAKARSSNASVDSLKKKMKARIQMRWQLEEGRRWRSSPAFWLYYATIKLGRRGKRKKKGSRKAGRGRGGERQEVKEEGRKRKVGSRRRREEEKGGKQEKKGGRKVGRESGEPYFHAGSYSHKSDNIM